VGKSTVAGALGLAALRRGRRAIVAEVHRRSDVEHAVTSRGVDHISIDPQEAMEEYLADQLPVRALADLLVSSRAFAYLAAATPGMRELLTAGKVWELAQDHRRTPGAEPYDTVVVDAPATGHGVAVLVSPRTFAEAARVGPIARQGSSAATSRSWSSTRCGPTASPRPRPRRCAARARPRPASRSPPTSVRAPSAGSSRACAARWTARCRSSACRSSPPAPTST
jgi:hypothetical protein